MISLTGMLILIGLTYFWMDTRIDVGRAPRWQWIIDSILIGVWSFIITTTVIVYLSIGAT